MCVGTHTRSEYGYEVPELVNGVFAVLYDCAAVSTLLAHTHTYVHT